MRSCVGSVILVTFLASSTRAETTAAPVGGSALPFAMRLYHELASADENVFFSPVSIVDAFGMLQAGARSETAEELVKALGFSSEDLPEAMAKLNEILLDSTRPYTLNLANALWVDNHFPVRPEFVTRLKDKYSATAFNCDFAGRSEPERQRINSWVEERTHDRIKNLLPPDSIGRDTCLVLTNAIYFKAEWARQFKKESTANGEFTLTSGKKITVPFMHEKVTGCGYYEDDRLQAIDLPYKGESASMLILLPKGQPLAGLEKSLTAEHLARMIGQLRRTEVQVTLPRFKLETGYDLIPPFKRLGVRRAFEAADFSGMTEASRNLRVTGAFHKAFVEVNEEGTEAAAATGIVVGRTAIARAIIFRADRPFLFIIRDHKSHEPLFMGRLTEPSGKSK